MNLVPYAGLYGEYYFSGDNANTMGLTTVPLLQGFSARLIGGLSARGGDEVVVHHLDARERFVGAEKWQ